MTRIVRLMQTRWMKTLFGVIFLSLLVWFFGPLLGVGQAHPLDTEIVRLLVIAVLFVLWLVSNLLREVRAARRDKELVDGVVAAPDADATASAEEVALLGDRLREALHALKRSKKSGRAGAHIAQLPWYMFIGPPGAGKTTALVNSGLNFPLADKQGTRALAGVGGTRNCDWWFTDQAVLIDTAGRYTTQDSHEAVDAAAWLGFLRLLKRHRRRQPLNGVLVAVSLSDLSQLSEADRLAHARSIRKRVRELHDELGVRLPVYVLFTKADLIAGFVEFFDGLSREEREQVWGMTLPLDAPGDKAASGPGGGTAKGRAGGIAAGLIGGGGEYATGDAGVVAQFGAEFDLLLARLNDRMLERVHQETDINRRRLIYGFPQQIASLRDVAASFLTETFRPSRLEARPLLRGAYFTSGTQDGTPIDRLLGAMANQFGLQRQAVTAFSGTGRSYFLHRLMREVVFGEAGLVSLDASVERRTRLIHLGAYAGAASFLLLCTGFWTASYLGNRDLMAQVHDQVQHYDALYAELAARGPRDTELPPVLPPLDAARNIRGGYADRERATPISLTFGLYQGKKLTTAAIDGYTRALNALLLPRLLARLEGQMRGHLDKPDFLYQALKVYLILGRQGPLDRDLVEQWLGTDFAASFPGDDQDAVRNALAEHVDALLEQPLTAIPLDGALVAQVRDILTRVPLAEYSYNRLLRSARVRELPVWTVSDNAGPGADRVFQLRSGRRLNTGVPGIYTWQGYHAVFLPSLVKVSQDVAEDGWVLGTPVRGVAATVAEASKLRRDVLGLYLDDYVVKWDAMIADIAIKPFGNLASGLDELNLLSAPDSPLRDLLQAIDQQTQLSRTNATDAALGKAEGKGAKVGQKLLGFAAFQGRKGLTMDESEVAGIFGDAVGTSTGGGGKPVDPATRVDAHFRAIHEFVAGGPEHPAGLEPAIAKIQAIYQATSATANAPNPGQMQLAALASGGGGGAGGGAAGLKDIAKDLPKPVAAMLTTVSQSSSALTASGASSALGDAWRSKVLPLCTEAFGRYPFIAGSAEDVPLDDFTRLLGPGGLVDGFFNDNLKPFVDTSHSPWRWQSADHTSLGLSPGTLTEFERAAYIRDGLFGGGTAMAVRFSLLPVSLDARIARATIDIAGTSMTYDHGPTESEMFQWPGAGGKTLVRVTLTPAGGGSGTVIERDGAWALLRLLDAGRVIPSGQPDRFRLVFSAPGGSVAYQLTASSVRNPFTMSALRAFRCPAKL